MFKSGLSFGREKRKNPSSRPSSIYGRFLDVDSSSITSSPRDSQLPLHRSRSVGFSHFDDNSDEETIEDYRLPRMSALYSNRRISTQSSTSQASIDHQSMASFRFSDQTLTSISTPPSENTLFERRGISRKASRQSLEIDTTKRQTTGKGKPPTLQPIRTSLLEGLNAGDEEGLQMYVQQLLQGSISSAIGVEEGEDEDVEVYQGFFQKRHKSTTSMPAPQTSINTQQENLSKSSTDKNRLSTVSMASDVSAVPSLIFSDADGQTRRPSALVNAPINHASKAQNRLSMSSVVSISSVQSIRTIDSTQSWFMDDDSNPPSPAAAEPVAGKRISFSEGVGLGMSLFDDGDSSDEEEEQAQETSPSSPESPLFFLMRPQISPTPPIDMPSIKVRTKPHKPSLSLATGIASTLPVSPGVSPRQLSFPPSQSPMCASPPKRRSRRRTASSECIVLEALEKMNVVMEDLARDDLNRKSVVGLDLPGNQVSVEAYGELWW